MWRTGGFLFTAPVSRTQRSYASNVDSVEITASMLSSVILKFQLFLFSLFSSEVVNFNRNRLFVKIRSRRRKNGDFKKWRPKIAVYSLHWLAWKKTILFKVYVECAKIQCFFLPYLYLSQPFTHFQWGTRCQTKRNNDKIIIVHVK